MYKKSTFIQFISLGMLMFLLPVFGYRVFCQGTKDIIPVTPEAAALAKMINYPINHNTGIPDISIPLHEIRADGLVLPITLQYHAGGFRINEQATRVGLGWSLSSDLQITRTVNGLDDFKKIRGYLDNNLVKSRDLIPQYPAYDNNAYPLWTESSTPYRNVYDLAVGDKDGMPDKFNYKLLNKSGSFYFQKDETGTGHTIVTVPYDDVKISWDDGRFIVRDTDGTTYYFGEQGNTNGSQLAAMGNELSGSDISYGSCDCTRSAWKCKRIVNSTGTGEINFEYEAKASQWRKFYKDKVEHYSNPEAPATNRSYFRSDIHPLTLPVTYNSLIRDYVDPWSISSPKFKLYYPGIIKFNVPFVDVNTGQVTNVYFPIESEDELPYSGSGVMGVSLKQITFTGGKVVFSGANRLATIMVHEGQDTLKRIAFTQSYTEAAYMFHARAINGQDFQGTLYLDELRVSGKQVPAVETYKFSYHDKECFGDHLKGHDVWGYRNGSTREINPSSGDETAVPLHTIHQAYYFSSHHYFPNIPFTFGSNDGQEMPIESYMKKGVISRIDYPTGGYTTFHFEANRYKIGSESYTGGGLRISSIYSYASGGGSPIEKHYKYGEQEDGTGVLVNAPVTNVASNGIINYSGYSYEQVMSYLTGPYNVPGDSTRPFYPITVGCNYRGCLNIIINETKTTYLPSSFLDFTYANGAPIYYTSVSECREGWTHPQGKTVHRYYHPEEFHDEIAKLWLKSHIEHTNIRRLQTDGFMGMKKEEIQYRNNNGTLEMLQKTEYKYRKYFRPQTIRVVYAFQRVFFQVVGGNYSGSDFGKYNQSQGFESGNDPSPYFWADEYGIAVGKMLLEETIETSYDGPDAVARRTVYSYGHPDYVQPSHVEVTDSRGSVMRTSYNYPYDFGATVYTQMVNRNMVAPVIEERVSEVGSSTEVSLRKTTWGNITSGAGFPAPVSVEQSEKGGPLTPVYRYDRYDEKGNILLLTEAGGTPTSYLWGYYGQYPVARVNNAVPADVAYAGFESDGKGNWAYTGPTVADTTAPTGNRIYSLSGGNLVKSGLSSGRKYLLTYWAKSASASAISGGAATVLRARNGWTHYRRVITSATSVTLSGSVWVDDVRLHPVEATMETYTYKPFVGMTGATDASGRTTRYDYDDFGRLWRVRDDAGNPVEAYQYHYHNQ